MIKIFVKQFILLLLCQSLYAQNKTSILDKNITIDDEKVTIAQYFAMLSAQGIILSYNNVDINLSKNVPLKKGNYPLAQLLHLLLGNDVKLKANRHKVIIYKTNDQIFTLSGFVYMGHSKETIPYASVKLLGSNAVVLCNDYGYYSISLSTKKNVLQASALGYISQTDTVDLQKSPTHHFYLQQGISNLPTLEVKTDRKLFLKEFTQIDTAGIKNLPFLLGEVDPMRIIGLKAGVTIDGLSVRGGTADQNLVLLDGAPIYNYTHFTGILSVFNNDIIKRVDFYKGGFPARYEGRLSSVIDIKTKDGDMQKYDGNIHMGLFNGSVKMEGPIIKNKLSFLTSYRRSWVDALSSITPFAINYYLSDANIKLNYIPDSTSRVYFSFYTGMDKLDLSFVQSSLQWANQVASLRWNKTYGSKAFHNTILMSSRFKTETKDELNPSSGQLNQIDNLGIENNFSYHWSNNFNSAVGLGVNYARFKSLIDETPDGLLKTQRSLQIKAYSDNQADLSNRFTLNYGLQYVAYVTEGKTYHSLQPRISLLYKLNSLNNFFVQFARVVQFYHQITSNIGATPNQFRSPSTAEISPEKSLNFDMGYHHLFQNNGRLSIQLYQKTYRDILIYKPEYGVGNTLIISENWRGVLLSGKGASKGVELEFSKQFKHFNVQSAYTLSKSELTFADVNEGKSFLAPNDYTNQFRLALSVFITKKWSFSTLFNYTTGGLVTVPNSYLSNKPSTTNDVIVPNNYRLKNNYNVSVGFSKRYVYKKTGNHGRFSFGVNNLLGRPNPIYVSTSYDNDNFQIEEDRIFRFFPYISYSYNFRFGR